MGMRQGPRLHDPEPVIQAQYPFNVLWRLKVILDLDAPLRQGVQMPFLDARPVGRSGREGHARNPSALILHDLLLFVNDLSLQHRMGP